MAQHPETAATIIRVIHGRGTDCRIARHQVGLRLYLWELLPARKPQLQALDFVTDLN